MKQILMPTDGSACSERAIRQGLEYAKALDAEITFLYALDDPIGYTAPDAASYYPQLYEDLKRAGEKALKRAQAIADEAGIPAKTVLVDRQDPVSAIRQAEKDADLVVIGTHGRRGVNRWMFGSVAEGALRRSTKPYLVVRSGEGREPVTGS